MSERLDGKTILVTGGARRIGKAISLAVAGAGGKVIIHYNQSPKAAQQTQAEILALGGQAEIVRADLGQPQEARGLVQRAAAYGPLFGLINNAAIFEPLSLAKTSLDDWERHLAVNLTAPFLLSQAFAAQPGQEQGRIVNILDWRALRPGADHFPYTISKSALAALTRASAAALAPNFQVNGLALGAVLPPADLAHQNGAIEDGASASRIASITASIPAGRWAEIDEVTGAVLFLLAGPAYITGEIIHVDGGRHLV